MDLKKLLSDLHLDSSPSGLGGCRTGNVNFPCCEYDITVFDDKLENDKIVEYENNFIRIHHGTLLEKNSKTLIQYDGMQIINDDSWELKMFLSKIKQKRVQLYRDNAKNLLIDSLFCSAKGTEGIKNNDVFSSCWVKAGAFCITESICSLNNVRISPTHMLDQVRKLEKNRINEKISEINDILGIERSTLSLLSRMVKSTGGFSDMIEQNNHSKIIQLKHNFLVENSLLTDCYFYLCIINKNLFLKIKNELSKRKDLIHVLKTAFDLESDPSKLEFQAQTVKDISNEILTVLGKE